MTSPPLPRRSPKRPLRLIALTVAATLVAGCAPTPAPTPTPTAAFASQEEAFAAAEATYRAYTDALNQVDLSDPGTFEAVFSFTTGDFQAADRRTLSELHAKNYVLVGETRLIKFIGVSSKAPFDTVRAAVCIDVSKSDVVDTAGHSVIAPDRADQNALRVTFVVSGTQLLIDHADREPESTCAP